MSEKVYEVLAKTNQKLNNALDEIERLASELAQARAELAESEANNKQLRNHIERRASGNDPLTIVIREEKNRLLQALWDIRIELRNGGADKALAIADGALRGADNG